MFQKGCCHDIGRENGMLASWTVFPWPGRCITLLKQPVFTKRHFQTKETSVKLPWAMARLVRNCVPFVGSQKVKEQSASIRESAVKFGVASAGNKESMNHLSHLLRISEFKIWQNNFGSRVKTYIYIIITFGGRTIHYLGCQGFDSQAIWFKFGMLSRPERLKRHWGSVQERSGKPQLHGRNRWAWRIHNAHHLLSCMQWKDVKGWKT